MPSMPEGHHLKLSVRKRQDFLALSVSLSIIASVYPTLWQWHKLPAELTVLEMVWMKVVSESDHWVCWSFNNPIVWCEEKSFVGSPHWFNYNSIKVTSHKSFSQNRASCLFSQMVWCRAIPWASYCASFNAVLNMRCPTKVSGMKPLSRVCKIKNCFTCWVQAVGSAEVSQSKGHKLKGNETWLIWKGV